jgi:hypothetical protein
MRFCSIALLLILGGFSPSYGAWVKGRVTDQKGNPIPGSYVWIESHQQQQARDITNSNGEFALKASEGKYALHCKSLGFKDYSEKIQLGKFEIVIQVILEEDELMLNSLNISSNRSDFAKYLMEKAEEKHTFNKENHPTITLNGYQRVSVQGPPIVPKGEDAVSDSAQKEAEEEIENGIDTTKWELFWRKRFPRLYRRSDSIEYAKLHSPAYRFIKDSIPEFRQQWLSEFASNHQFAPNGKYHEDVEGYKKYTPYRPWIDAAGFSVGFNYGEKAIWSDRDRWEDPYSFESRDALGEFDLLDHHLNVPKVAQKLIPSPFSNLGRATYRYNIIDVQEKKGGNVYCIQIQPIIKKEALINAQIWIQDSTFNIEKTKYQFTPRALTYYHQFEFEEEYMQWQNRSLPKNRSIHYTIIENQDTILGKTEIHFDNPIQLETSPKIGLEVQTFADDAEKKEDDFWPNQRRFPMDSIETAYQTFCDSVQKKYLSPRYKQIRDSLYNHVSFWDVTLNGMGFKNSFKGYSYFINPLISQLNFWGIGGYRHVFGGSASKEINARNRISVNGRISYGVANKDLGADLRFNWDYKPEKYMRTSIQVTNLYEQINGYASLATMFSRSNFVKREGLTIAQRMELATGLFGEVSLSHMRQLPINTLKQDNWSGQVFGENNKPIDFEDYLKTEVSLLLQYRIGQQYYRRNGRKYYLPNRNPEIFFTYRKGIPNLAKSEVNFDYVELSIRQKFRVPVLGEGEWAAYAGTYLNKKSLRLMEYRYFRGSDFFLFSDPTNSLQLLGPTFSTPNAFFKANYFHHFNGLFTNKLPLIHRLKITEAAGAATLIIADQNFYHQELYLGMERVCRIKKQLFRLGLYACTSDNNFGSARLTYKFGIAFFNTYAKNWTY